MWERELLCCFAHKLPKYILLHNLNAIDLRVVILIVVSERLPLDMEDTSR